MACAQRRSASRRGLCERRFREEAGWRRSARSPRKRSPARAGRAVGTPSARLRATSPRCPLRGADLSAHLGLDSRPGLRMRPTGQPLTIIGFHSPYLTMDAGSPDADAIFAKWSGRNVVPVTAHSGLWELPIVTLFVPEDQRPGGQPRADGVQRDRARPRRLGQHRPGAPPQLPLTRLGLPGPVHAVGGGPGPSALLILAAPRYAPSAFDAR
jgi:hypothetical protein